MVNFLKGQYVYFTLLTKASNFRLRHTIHSCKTDKAECNIGHDIFMGMNRIFHSEPDKAKFSREISMSMKAILALTATLTLTSASWSQTDKMAPMGRGEATIYRDANFQGPAVFVGEAKSDLQLSWSVKSIRVRSGTWQLCARTRYRAPCATVSADEADLRRVSRLLYTVQSMRPLGSPAIQPPVQPEPPAGNSLRGMSAEFFPAPGRYNVRILSCPNGNSTANCAARTADDFCRSVGWNGSKSETQETINRRVYLADVLCVRSGY